MESLFRFSDYDIFGYLVSGLAVLGVCDATIATHLVLDVEWTVTHVGFVIISAYVIGHIVASAATLIFDRLLVRGLIGTPSNLLMRRKTGERAPEREKREKWRRGWARWMLGEYLEPIDSSVRSRVIERAGIDPHAADNDAELGEKVFWRAWPVIKRAPIPYGRMDSFLRLYGFCRHLSFVSLLAAIGFAYAIWVHPPPASDTPRPDVWWIFGALTISVVLFRRYLKFFRLYGVEIFSTYAESEEVMARKLEK